MSHWGKEIKEPSLGIIQLRESLYLNSLLHVPVSSVLFLIHESEYMPAWKRMSCESVCPCVCLCVCLSPYVSVCLYLTKVVIEQYKKHPLEKEGSTLQKCLPEFYKGLSDCLQLTQITSSYQPVSKGYVQYLWWNFILKDCFPPLNLLLLAIDTHVLYWVGVWKSM